MCGPLVMRLSNSSTMLTNKAFVHQGCEMVVEGEWCPSADMGRSRTPWVGPQGPFLASRHHEKVYGVPVQHVTQLGVRASPCPCPRGCWISHSADTVFLHFSHHLVVRLVCLPEAVGLTVGSCYLSLQGCSYLGYFLEDLKYHGWKCVLSHVLN